MKSIKLALVDVVFIMLAFMSAQFLKFGAVALREYSELYSVTLLVLVITHLIVYYVFGLYKRIWEVAGFTDYILIVLATFANSVVAFMISTFPQFKISFTTLTIFELILFLFLLASRFSFRIFNRLVNGKVQPRVGRLKRVLIIGAGDAATMVLKEIEKTPSLNLEVLGLIDDNPNKRGKKVRGVYVIGSREDIKSIVESRGIEEVIFAIPSMSESDKTEILNLISETKVKVKTMPGIYELVNKGVNLSSLREIEITDLLGRKEITQNVDEISHYIKNKTILVTGGGGSIGSELCRQISGFSPKKLVILDIYENTTYDIQLELMRNFPLMNLDVIISSVRDSEKINEVFQEIKPDIVFHAAAHKHVPLMERSPAEAIKNNVFGTINVAKAAIENGVQKFIFISTDKAVNPTNIMGASKRLCEMIIQTFNKYSESTEFVAVRFGNVLGSNGSVIPVFKKQIEKGGPVTVTHKDITRYFMTIPEAVSLVLQAGYYARGGEIFILDMGQPVKIYDLAVNMIKLSGYEPHTDIKIEFTGLRPGEKLYEELLMDEEGIQNTPNHLIHVGKPIEINEKEFKKQLEHLKQVIIDNEDKPDVIKKEVSKIVTTYTMEV